jgi:predicted GIY-YIG superfamily endonuclease
MQFIYILELQEGKYYVGKTIDITRRIEEHISGKGSEWTKKYPFIRLLHAETTNDIFDEDKTTKKLMLEKGIQNVRGGTYCKLSLSDQETLFLNRELRGALNICQGCGKEGHFIKNCKEEEMITIKVVNPNQTETKPLSTKAINIICEICGKFGHKKEICSLNSKNN